MGNESKGPTTPWEWETSWGLEVHDTPWSWWGWLHPDTSWVVVKSQEDTHKIVDLKKLSLGELEKKLDQNKKLIYDIYLQTIPHYNPIRDDEKKDYIISLLQRDLNLSEILAVRFREKYSDFVNIPINEYLFLDSIINLWGCWDIDDKDIKALFFIFMWQKNKGYDFSDEKTSLIYFYTTFSEVIKEYFIKGYFNTTWNSNVPFWEMAQIKEKTNNRSDYRYKEQALVGEWIWNDDTNHREFKRLLDEKYYDFVRQIFTLVAPDKAKLVLEKLKLTEKIPKESPIFWAIVQLFEWKNFEKISMWWFEELENWNLKRAMENLWIPTTKDELERLLIQEETEKDNEISSYSIPWSGNEVRGFIQDLQRRTQKYLR